MDTERKKILFVITKSNFGGAQRYVYELATSLPKDAFDVTVAFGGDGMLKQKLETAGIKTREIKSFARDINLGKEIKSLFELSKIIQEIKPDIIHLNSSKAGGSGALIARIKGVPKIVFTAHGWPFLEDRNILWKSIVWLLSWTTSLLAHITILVSEYDRNHAHMPLVQKKFTVIHTALPRIDFLTRQTARQILFTNEIIEAHQNDVLLTTMAELTQNKNILTAIKAVYTYNRSEAPQKIFYTIMGEGELFSSLREQVRLHGMEHEVHFSGYIPEARIYLNAFDIFLLPSYKEGLPYALLEAGYAGLPSIASAVGGIPEIIENEKNGLLINPKDQKTIVNALWKYTTDTEGRLQHSALLKTKIDSSFNLITMLEKTIAVYKSH